MDWEQCKTDYITGSDDVSYTALSKKYGIGRSAIGNRASKEKWVQQREQFRSERQTAINNAIIKDEASRRTRILNVADKLLDRLERKITSSGDFVTERGWRDLTGALKDIVEIQGAKNERDIREQEARIKALIRNAETEKPETHKIEIVGLPDDFGV